MNQSLPRGAARALLLVALTISALLAACGAPQAPQAADQTGSSSAPSGGDLKVVWYAPAPHPYFEEVQKGVAAFEQEFGVTVEKQIGPDWNQGSQDQRLEALAAKGFNLFSIYPSDGSGANGVYQELTQRGVRVVNFGASTREPTPASFVVATDVKAAAMQATEELIKATWRAASSSSSSTGSSAS